MVPKPLQYLIDVASTEVETLLKQYQDGKLTLDQWQSEMAALLAEYHLAAMMTGLDSLNPSDLQIESVSKAMAEQLTYLAGFVATMRTAGDWMARWYGRAAMYADAISARFWKGKTWGLPLPAVPGDATSQCLTKCKCSWEIVKLAGDGNYDCYWRLGVAEHCQTCQERARLWNPYRVRNWYAQDLGTTKEISANICRCGENHGEEGCHHDH